MPFSEGLDPWATWDFAAIIRALCDADAQRLIVADGAGGALDRAAFWRIACGVSHVAAAAPSPAFALMLPAGAVGQAWLAGALMAGRPFALLDARDPPARSAEICVALGLSACLAQPGAILPTGISPLPAPSEAETPAAVASAPDAPAIIVPTSGSTGRPKGIVQGRRGLLFRARQLAREFGFGPGSVYLSTAANGSISGLVHGFAALLSGGLLLRVDTARLGLAGVLRAAEEAGGATALQGLPSVLTALLAAPGAKAALGRVTRCQSSGAQLLASDVQALRTALPPTCALVNVYGLTEAPALLRWDVPPGWEPDAPRIPAGEPLEGHVLAIHDEAGAPVAQGEVGELVATGPTIALGVWLDGRLVHGDRIALVPGSPGERALHTGDLARIRPDGLFEIVGRADRQVKIGGRRIELEEIEERLRRIPGVTAATVVADREVPGVPRIYAAIEATPEASPDIAEASRRELRAALPSYMQPARLIALPELPRLPGGKVDGVALLARFRGVPTAPDAANPVEPRLSRAWRSTLGRVPAAEVTFREAGGDSLGFLQLALEIERLTGHPNVLSTLDEDMTAAQMSTALAAPRPARYGPRVLMLPGNGGETEPLARLREQCREIEIVAAHYPSWRAFVRAGGEVQSDAAALLPQALAAFGEDQPPMLAGYSYGGAVAHALAHLLAGRGRPVQRLLILDTGAWPGAQVSAPVGEDRPPALRETPADLVQRWLRWRFRQAGRTPRQARLLASVLPARPPPVRAARRLWRELELHLREAAMLRWARGDPAPIAVPGTLFLSQEPRPAAPRDLGWAARCDLKAIVPVAGDHLGMLRPPHGAAFRATFSRAVLGDAATYGQLS